MRDSAWRRREIENTARILQPRLQWRRPRRSTSSFFIFGFRNHRPPFLDAVLDFLFHALLGRLVVTLFRAQIILHDEMLRMIVRVLVSDAVAQSFRAFVMRIAQMLGHG